MNLKVWYNIIIFHIIHHIQFSIFDQEYKISMMLQTVWIQYTGEIDKICWKCGIHIGLSKFEIPSGTMHVTPPYSVPPQCLVHSTAAASSVIVTMCTTCPVTPAPALSPPRTTEHSYTPEQHWQWMRIKRSDLNQCQTLCFTWTPTLLVESSGH